MIEVTVLLAKVNPVQGWADLMARTGCCSVLIVWLVCIYRDHPEKKLDFTVSRGGSIVHIPVTPALAADGGGRIGVSLAPNAKIVRRAAKGISEALSLTGSEFSRLLNIVTGGALPTLTMI